MMQNRHDGGGSAAVPGIGNHAVTGKLCLGVRCPCSGQKSALTSETQVPAEPFAKDSTQNKGVGCEDRVSCHIPLLKPIRTG